MNINFHIKTKNIDLTPEINAQVHDKLIAIEKFVNTSGDHEVLAQVEIKLRSKHHKKGDIYKTELNLISSGSKYYASAKAGTVDEALDILKEEIIKQLRRSKDKKEHLFKRGSRHIKRMLRL